MFSFNRMFNLIKRITTIRSKNLIWVFLALIIASILNGSGMTKLGNAIIIPCIMICFAGFYAFEGYKTPALRANNILIPATVEEKYFANFIYVFIFLPLYIIIAFTIALSLSDIVTFLIYGKINSCFFISVKQLYNGFNINYIISTFLGMSIFFFGALFFKKNRLLKTAVSIFSFFVLWGTIVISINYAITGSTNINFILYNISTTIANLSEIIITIFFLILTYFRLKEERV